MIFIFVAHCMKQKKSVFIFDTDFLKIILKVKMCIKGNCSLNGKNINKLKNCV